MNFLSGDAVDTTAFAYACGRMPALGGCIRQSAADFRVDEDCPITLSGSGEHLWCRIEKTGLTTQDALQALSRTAGVHPRQIGFAGLKDRHAITSQWFSLAWPVTRTLPDLSNIDGVRVLEQNRHERKLRRGAHRGNRFVIRIRDLQGATDSIDTTFTRIGAEGVPNYFGAQRFGHGGRNLALSRALFAGKRLSRNRRGFALSAARSLLFNAVLDARVQAGNWNTLIDGEAVMLDGTHSVFARDTTQQPQAELEARLAAFDIHPSGPLSGRGETLSDGRALVLERDVLAPFAELVAGLERHGVDAARRALRLPVRELDWQMEASDTLSLRFWLPAGAFATSVLREIVRTD